MTLLDSHVLIWAVADSKRLSKAAASAIRRARRGGDDSQLRGPPHGHGTPQEQGQHNEYDDIRRPTPIEGPSLIINLIINQV